MNPTGHANKQEFVEETHVLPFVGYANRIWRRLSQTSEADLASPMGRPDKMAYDVERLLTSFQVLSTMSEKARTFAEQRCFEFESENVLMR